MADEFIVLRKVAQDSHDRPVFRGADPPTSGSPVTVSLELLDHRDQADIRRDPAVVGFARPMPVSLIQPTTDQDATPQPAGAPGMAWGIVATRAYQSAQTGSGIAVAVLDTGIDRTHEAFAGMELVERDFTGEGLGDNHGHGTHCAGIIFGRDTQGVRIGVASGVERGLIAKIIGQSGCTTAALFQAITWAVDEGAHIVSMSLSLDFPGAVKRMIDDDGLPPELATSRALESYLANVRLFDHLSEFVEAQSTFRDHGGTILVAAAGNASRRDLRDDYEIAVAPPANARGVLSVGAVGRNPASPDPSTTLVVADFSNSGPDLVGPGKGVLSARVGGGHTVYSGTSMAAPHVAGIAALWAEKMVAETGRVRARDLIRQIESSATTSGLAPGFIRNAVGLGLVQAP